MKATRLIVLLGTFGFGFASAWMSKPVSASREDASRGKTTASERAANPERPAKEAKDPHMAELLKALGEARYNQPKTKEALDQIKTEEFSRLIDALVRKAGFTGLDYRDEKSVQDLVLAWYDRDPEAALGWVLAIQNTKDREELLPRLIGKTLKNDLQQGLALLRQYGRQEDGGWIAPPELFEKLGQLSSDEMVSTLGCFIATDGSSSGTSVTYPKGFDFQRLLDGIADLQKGLKDKQGLGVVPGNILWEWARRDPGSAWEWLQQGKKVPSAGPEEFFKGYRSVASTDEFSSFLAEAVSDQNVAVEERFRTAWNTLVDEPSSEMLNAFMQKLPGERSQNLLYLFDATPFGSGGKYDLFKEILLRQMSPAERIDTLSAHFRKNHSDFGKKLYPSLLQQLGHSEDEIQRMLSPAANP
jgi:hypothetical protein